MSDKPPFEEMGGKGGFHGGEGTNIFFCPECNKEKAFPGQKPDEKPMCPVCAVPMKTKIAYEG